MIDENTVNTEEEALNFINKYGFVTIFPLRKVVFPNLYQATEEKIERRNSIRHGVGQTV